MERFHSRRRQPCLLEQKNKKIVQLHSIGLVHQHERRFIILGHKYGCRDFMWKHSTVEALLTDTLISGQLNLRTRCLKPRFKPIQTLYFYIFVSGHSCK